MKEIYLYPNESKQHSKIMGTFNFLNAGNLVYHLDNAIDAHHMQTNYDTLHIDFHLQYVDSHCKRLLFKFMHELENTYQQVKSNEIVIVWKYDWFDDNIRELGHLLNEEFSIPMRQIEIDEVAENNLAICVNNI